MATWRKSSYSGTGNQSDCVELAALEGEVGVRDSKNPDAGHLSLNPEAMAGLMGAIKAGDLDL
ncbi:DUF397 domain-containing protein [Actinomadura sp. NPDC048021]|uniref:DUF397 domain-containing protein n=1 Tax=Actinomadura sp. NPDC048021 TaxID=3155385 RepID=UPI0033DC27FF